MNYPDEIAKRMRPFSEFSTIMTRLPSLGKLKPDQRDELLSELYRLAAGKALRARWAEQQRLSIPKLREQSRHISKVVTLFRNLAKALEDAHSSFGGSISEVEDAYVARVFRSAVPGDCHPRLSVSVLVRQDTVAGLTAKFLRSFTDEAIHVQERIATNIPPSWRTKREKQLARQYFVDTHADEKPRSWPLVGPTTRAIHHWLIGETAACLERFHQKDPKFKIRGKLIAQMFEAAFDDFSMNEESIKKELRRQRKHGRPQYTLHTWR
jgi:hypothetical protein